MGVITPSLALIFRVLLISFALPVNVTFAGSLQVKSMHATSLQENVIGIDPNREIRVYLPTSYQSGLKHYPVVYYFHNMFWSNEQLFGEGNEFKSLLDLAMNNGELDEVIVVAGDFRAPNNGTFYGNSPSSGRWLDHITLELIPYIDKHYRTLPNQRIGLGDFFGGYAVLRLAMDSPGLFAAIYSMHPVGTATGETLIHEKPDWHVMNTAKNWQELQVNVVTSIFMSMAQAYLPNPNKPPFYADLMVELKQGELVINSDNVRLLQSRFLLDAHVPFKAEALKELKAFKMDWGRLDTNPDHVYANRKFTRLLMDYGVDHEAEEYNGGAFDKMWGEQGRVRSDVFPFIQKVLQQYK